MRPRRPKLDPAVRARLALEAGERLLAWATDIRDSVLVGTDRALYLADRRLPWEQIERADWQADTNRLAVVEVDEWGLDEVRTEVTVADPGQLLDLLRERVTKSVLLTSYVPIEGRRGGLTVVARRSPTGHGPVAWSFVLSNGLDPADPAVAELARSARAAAMSELGPLA